MNQLLRFAIVGVIGFVVDTAVLYAMLKGLGLYWPISRLIAFLSAVYATWLINRRFTFQPAAPEKSWAEFGKYLIAMSGGGAVNLFASGIVLSTMAPDAFTPAIAVAVGSLAGLTVNFVAAKLWVYRRPTG